MSVETSKIYQPFSYEVKVDKLIFNEVKEVIVNSIGGELTIDSLTDDYPLAGNVLDSMAVTNLIIALEEHFDFMFEDEDLNAEAFETVISLVQLVKNKI